MTHRQGFDEDEQINRVWMLPFALLLVTVYLLVMRYV
jgi:hypothetical protein